MSDKWARDVSASSLSQVMYKRRGRTMVLTSIAGKWRTHPRSDYVGADGDPRNNTDPAYPVPSAPPMCLIAVVKAPDGTRGPPFAVRSYYEFAADVEGTIFLGPNDSNLRDNDGTLTVDFQYL